MKNKYWENLSYLQRSIKIGLILSALFIFINTALSIIQIVNDKGMFSCGENVYCIISYSLMAILLELPKVIIIMLLSVIIGLIIDKNKSRKSK